MRKQLVRLNDKLDQLLKLAENDGVVVILDAANVREVLLEVGDRGIR